MEQKLQNQIAIVTGASSGIGAGVAKSLAGSGATVVVNYPVDGAKVAAEAVLAEIISLAVCSRTKSRSKLAGISRIISALSVSMLSKAFR